MNVLTAIQTRVMTYLDEFDHRNRWFGVGRSFLALGNLITLLFTPMQALIVPVGSSSGAVCTNIRVVSLLCVGNPAAGLEWRRWAMIVILLVVASGYRPRFTALPHVWVTLTIGGSMTLPDGGDAIALTISLLIVPLAFADGRTWHWQPPTKALSPTWQAISSIALLAVRAQIAFIYLDSAITKFAVDDWSNGTAEFYILRDPGFGDSGVLHGFFQSLSSSPLFALGMSWGAILVEIAIGLALLLSWRWRILALVLDVGLHLMIIMTMGLFSFSAVMMGSAILAANPAGANERRTLVAPNGTGLDASKKPTVTDLVPSSPGELEVPVGAHSGRQVFRSGVGSARAAVLKLSADLELIVLQAVFLYGFVSRIEFGRRRRPRAGVASPRSRGPREGTGGTRERRPVGTHRRGRPQGARHRDASGRRRVPRARRPHRKPTEQMVWICAKT